MTRTPQDAVERFVVLLAEDAAAAGARTMTDVAGLRTASTADLAGTEAATMLGEADGLVLHELGVAVVSATGEQAEALRAAVIDTGPITQVEPERTVYAIAEPGQDDGPPAGLTWGLRAMRVPDSEATGAGIRVAVLDTGFTRDHPDFAGRTVTVNSFVPGEDATDGHGHGTHVIGTACGPRRPETGPGYGVAPGADIYAGKVLGADGSGSDGQILAGIAWAVSSGCAVVSLSLGAPVEPGQPFSPAFERIARRAMRRGTLMVAAAGNESTRSQGQVGPVGHPANCPSIMAVGAIDEQGGIADFSSGTVDPGGAVDVTGPGVRVHSSWPLPERYRTLSGTSMATPHVAGDAALLAERYGARGWELWARLGQRALRSALPSVDVGAGMVRAPV